MSLNKSELEQIKTVLQDARAFAAIHMDLVEDFANQADLYPRIHPHARVNKLEQQLRAALEIIQRELKED